MQHRNFLQFNVNDLVPLIPGMVASLNYNLKHVNVRILSGNFLMRGWIETGNWHINLELSQNLTDIFTEFATKFKIKDFVPNLFQLPLKHFSPSPHFYTYYWWREIIQMIFCLLQHEYSHHLISPRNQKNMNAMEDAIDLVLKALSSSVSGNYRQYILNFITDITVDLSQGFKPIQPNTYWIGQFLMVLIAITYGPTQKIFTAEGQFNIVEALFVELSCIFLTTQQRKLIAKQVACPRDKKHDFQRLLSQTIEVFVGNSTLCSKILSYEDLNNDEKSQIYLYLTDETNYPSISQSITKILLPYRNDIKGNSPRSIPRTVGADHDDDPALPFLPPDRIPSSRVLSRMRRILRQRQPRSDRDPNNTNQLLDPLSFGLPIDKAFIDDTVKFYKNKTKDLCLSSLSNEITLPISWFSHELTDKPKLAGFDPSGYWPIFKDPIYYQPSHPMVEPLNDPKFKGENLAIILDRSGSMVGNWIELALGRFKESPDGNRYHGLCVLFFSLLEAIHTGQLKFQEYNITLFASETFSTGWQSNIDELVKKAYPEIFLPGGGSTFLAEGEFKEIIEHKENSIVIMITDGELEPHNAENLLNIMRRNQGHFAYLLVQIGNINENVFFRDEVGLMGHQVTVIQDIESLNSIALDFVLKNQA